MLLLSGIKPDCSYFVQISIPSMSSVKPLNHKLHLPPIGKSFWIPEEGLRSVLLYHSWGTRDVFKNPVPPVHHEGPSQLILLEGTATLDLKDSTHQIQAPSYIYIPSKTPQGWKNLKSLGKMRMLCWIWAATMEASVSDEKYQIKKISKKIIEKVLLMHEETRASKNLSQHQAIEQLQAIHILMRNWTQSISAKETGKSDLFKAATKWIEDHLSIIPKVYDLMDYLGVDARILYELFMAGSGKSPEDYIHDLRLEKSHQLLKNGSSVKEVAYALGYKHPNDFSRAFAKHFGSSPSQMNEKLKAK